MVTTFKGKKIAYAVLHVWPAYGRKFSTANEALDSWNSEQDWTAAGPGMGGLYIGKHDKLAMEEVRSMGFNHIGLHYGEDQHNVQLVPVEGA